MKLYAIRSKKNPELLLRLSIFSNGDAEYCNECGARFEMGDWSTNIYVVTVREIAENALKVDPKWYNAGLSDPQWPKNFDPNQWEVFEVNAPSG